MQSQETKARKIAQKHRLKSHRESQAAKGIAEHQNNIRHGGNQSGSTAIHREDTDSSPTFQ
jgi:hypothetical protein